MLNDKPDGVSSQDELTRIIHCLMQKEYSQLDSVPLALRLIQDMLAESHPSGHPDPNTLTVVADLLREEKFKEIRKNQKHTPLSTEIQLLINQLKALKMHAMQVRHEESSPSGWAAQSWDSRDATIPFPISPILFLIFLFILFGALHFLDIRQHTKEYVLFFYLFISFGFATLIKSSGLIILSCTIATGLFFIINYHPHLPVLLFY